MLSRLFHAATPTTRSTVVPVVHKMTPFFDTYEKTKKKTKTLFYVGCHETVMSMEELSIEHSSEDEE